MSTPEDFVVAPARLEDVEAMASLAAARRTEYEAAQPLFWKQSMEAIERHIPFLTESVNNGQVVSLVASDGDALLGFVLGSLVPPPPVYDPGGPSGFIDDLAVDDPETWATVGVALLAPAREQLAELGAAQVVVVCGHHDEAKMRALMSAGLSRASEWLVAPARGETL